MRSSSPAIVKNGIMNGHTVKAFDGPKKVAQIA